MNRHHKWFRKERYKQKLERDVDNHKTYFSNVYFTTDEPDPRDLRENIHTISWAADFHDISIEEATKRYIEREKKWGNGKFIYHHRPEVPYTTRYYYKKAGRSKHQKFLKKKTSRRVRREFKQKGELYQHNHYRRVQEFWWELD